MASTHPDWIWYGEDSDGKVHVSTGRWQSHKCQVRYKIAEVQPTEHDHGNAIEFEKYDGIN